MQREADGVGDVVEHPVLDIWMSIRLDRVETLEHRRRLVQVVDGGGALHVSPRSQSRHLRVHARSM